MSRAALPVETMAPGTGIIGSIFWCPPFPRAESEDFMTLPDKLIFKELLPTFWQGAALFTVLV